jgi:hypothetical protein
VRGATCRARRGLSKCAAMRSQRFCESSEVERNETQKAKKVRLAEHVARSDFSGCSLRVRRDRKCCSLPAELGRLHIAEVKPVYCLEVFIHLAYI